MQAKRTAVRITGHLQVNRTPADKLADRKRYRFKALWRDGAGRHQKVLGWAHVDDSGKRTDRGAVIWRAGNGPKPDGHLTPKDAELALRRILAEAPGVRVKRTTDTFRDAADDWYADGENRRGLKTATLFDYRHALDKYILPEIGPLKLEDLTPEHVKACVQPHGATRTGEKTLAIIRAVLTRAERQGRIRRNIANDVNRPRVSYSGDFDTYDRAELDALLAAVPSESDRTFFLAAAMTGLRRGELVALRWRDVNFAGEVIRVRHNYSHGRLVTPKSGKVRSVPMIAEVARALDGLSRRGRFTGPDGPVFPGEGGGHMDPSALGRRYRSAIKRAGIRHLPLHSLRHYFGSQAINVMSPVEVQAVLGHADVRTTSRYMHAKSRADDAARLARAFAREPIEAPAPDETATHETQRQETRS